MFGQQSAGDGSGSNPFWHKATRTPPRFSLSNFNYIGTDLDGERVEHNAPQGIDVEIIEAIIIEFSQINLRPWRKRHLLRRGKSHSNCHFKENLLLCTYKR